MLPRAMLPRRKAMLSLSSPVKAAPVCTGRYGGLQQAHMSLRCCLLSIAGYETDEPLTPQGRAETRCPQCHGHSHSFLQFLLPLPTTRDLELRSLS